MSVQAQSHTYLPPTGARRSELEDIFAHLPEADRTYQLCGPDGTVDLPAEVYQVLRQVVEAMSRGQAVTVTPNEPVLTTQQAAEILGVSRPTVIKLIEGGRLPAERVSNRRTLHLTDVLEFREQRRQEQFNAIAATTFDFDDEAELDDILAASRAARSAVVKRRQEIS